MSTLSMGMLFPLRQKRDIKKPKKIITCHQYPLMSYWVQSVKNDAQQDDAQFAKAFSAGMIELPKARL